MSWPEQQLVFIWQNLDYLLLGFPQHRPGGLLLTLLLAGSALALGLLLAWPLGFGLRAGSQPLRQLCRLYVLLFRGLPLLLVLVGVHQLGNVSRLGLQLTPVTSALVALTLYTSAYQAAIVESGLGGLPEGLVASAQTLSASRWQRFWWVEVSYISRTMLPAFLGEAVSLIKDSSIVLVLGVAELMGVARLALGSDVGNATYWVGIYLAVGALYFLVALLLTWAASRWEKGRRPDGLVRQLT